MLGGRLRHTVRSKKERDPDEQLTDILLVIAGIIAFLLVMATMVHIESLSEAGTRLTFPEKPINRSP